MISMKTVAAAAVSMSLLLGAGSAFSADLKIAVIRAQDVIENSPQYAQAQAKIKDEFEKRKADLDAKTKKLVDDVEAYKKNADVMSPDDREKKENDLITRQNDIKYQQKKFQQDFQSRDHEMTQNLMDQVKSVITQVAKDKGYDLVIQDPVYSISSIDITDEVLKRLKAAKSK